MKKTNPLYKLFILALCLIPIQSIAFRAAAHLTVDRDSQDQRGGADSH